MFSYYLFKNNADETSILKQTKRTKSCLYLTEFIEKQTISIQSFII